MVEKTLYLGTVSMKKIFILIIFGTTLLCSAGLPGLMHPIFAQVITDGKIPSVAFPACAEESQTALNRCAVQWSR
jgi:hypothetical protein